MSTYGPFGYSFTLAFARHKLIGQASSVIPLLPGATRTRPSPGLIYINYLVPRLLLGVDMGLIFELVGSFVLSQTKYNGYDFDTHKSAHAIVEIGAFGGIGMGLILILVDVFLMGQRNVNNGGDHQLKHGKPVPTDYRRGVMAQAFGRAVLWPGMAAASGVIGTILYHLAMNSKPQPKAKYRATTGAVVQTVGALVTVTGPSIVQFLLLSISNNIGRQPA